MNKLELEFLHSELNRTSEWVRFADSKAGFLSAYYLIVFGLIISQKQVVLANVDTYQGWLLLVYMLFIVFGLILFALGLYLLVQSIFPRLDNATTDTSLFFYAHVAKMKPDDYHEKLEALTDEGAKAQITEQIHANSVIAEVKMMKIKQSTKCLIWLVGAVLALILLS